MTNLRGKPKQVIHSNEAPEGYIAMLSDGYCKSLQTGKLCDFHDYCTRSNYADRLANKVGCIPGARKDDQTVMFVKVNS